MHHFNSHSFIDEETVHNWNFYDKSSEFVCNHTSYQCDYYESKMIFDGLDHASDGMHEPVCTVTDHLDDAISFLGSDTGLLHKTRNDPVSIRVVWNLLENVSRVYLPKITTTSDHDTVCLSVKGDPYAVRENGVMLDALNYVRTLLSETSRALPAF